MKYHYVFLDIKISDVDTKQKCINELGEEGYRIFQYFDDLIIMEKELNNE